MTDEDFPNRPDHHHYRLLTDLVVGQDVLEGAATFYRLEKIDPASVDYMALNRALVVQRLRQLNPERNLLAEIERTWLDGFQLGYMFAVNRTDMP